MEFWREIYGIMSGRVWFYQVKVSKKFLEILEMVFYQQSSEMLFLFWDRLELAVTGFDKLEQLAVERLRTFFEIVVKVVWNVLFKTIKYKYSWIKTILLFYHEREE